MGIVNVTPDSFSDGGVNFDVQKAVAKAREFSEAGADIIDIGGESTRPGSEPVSLRDELGRVVPVMEALQGSIKSLLSVDTYKAEVARQALAAGAHIVNDISGGNFDPEMPDVVAEFEAGSVLMHIKGTPRNMQDNPRYKNLIEEIHSYLARSVKKFINKGVPRESIMVDPGIGFGKTLHHNLMLISRIRDFCDLAAGVLVGPSRKSFIGLLTERGIHERLEGTIAASVACVLKGADVIRAHDVKEVSSAVKIADALKHIRENGE